VIKRLPHPPRPHALTAASQKHTATRHARANTSTNTRRLHTTHRAERHPNHTSTKRPPQSTLCCKQRPRPEAETRATVGRCLASICRRVGGVRRRRRVRRSALGLGKVELLPHRRGAEPPAVAVALSLKQPYTANVLFELAHRAIDHERACEQASRERRRCTVQACARAHTRSRHDRSISRRHRHTPPFTDIATTTTCHNHHEPPPRRRGAWQWWRGVT
jgi:hypothetical protein